MTSGSSTIQQLFLVLLMQQQLLTTPMYLSSNDEMPVSLMLKQLLVDVSRWKLPPQVKRVK
jgi:uncharacterized lipoprotein YajG